tara:strand:+ start:428 stop:688 length:261 start_codon:yes stop_codon:yes gene_type:complete
MLSNTNNIIEEMVYQMGKSGSIEDRKKNVTKRTRNSKKSVNSSKKLFFQKNIVYSLKKKFSEDNLNEYYLKYLNKEKQYELTNDLI